MSRRVRTANIARRVVAATQYRTLNDSADNTGRTGLKPGTTEVWYMKQSFFRNGSMGYEWLKENDLLPDRGALGETHVRVGKIAEKTPEVIWMLMQGEVWSPEGEANQLIRRKKLQHTSMVMGDIVVVGGKTFIVDRMGFKTI